MADQTLNLKLGGVAELRRNYPKLVARYLPRVFGYNNSVT